jgi:hypothetical protein
VFFDLFVFGCFFWINGFLTLGYRIGFILAWFVGVEAWNRGLLTCRVYWLSFGVKVQTTIIPYYDSYLLNGQTGGFCYQFITVYR